VRVACVQPNGKEDSASLHAGCPVIRGTKWSATKWMHVGEFLYAPRPTPRHPRLASWGLFGYLSHTLPSNSPHEHMILRVELVGSHGRWKRPWLQTAHMSI
jgi:hypothetical protein